MRGGNRLELYAVIYYIEIIVHLVMLGTFIWLLFRLGPIIWAMIQILFFPPKLPPVDPLEVVPPEGSVHFEEYQPADSDQCNSFVSFSLDGNWADVSIPNMLPLCLKIIAELSASGCIAVEIRGGFTSPKRDRFRPARFLAAHKDFLENSVPPVSAYRLSRDSLLILSETFAQIAPILQQNMERQDYICDFQIYAFPKTQHVSSAKEASKAISAKQYDFLFSPTYYDWDTNLQMECNQNTVDLDHVQDTVERLCKEFDIILF